MPHQENSYKGSKLSRFIDQANEAIYFVEERERLGIKITDADHSHPSKKNKKKSHVFAKAMQALGSLT
ncbi:hypothetical protein SynPROS91_01459 [Synechococcus sp. PROS-9-1]|nr:hypothetical protein SynPROS91_01459 [Synechococcus sp. PROS-9-1]